jgi:hypothetical protein
MFYFSEIFKFKIFSIFFPFFFFSSLFLLFFSPLFLLLLPHAQQRLTNRENSQLTNRSSAPPAALPPRSHPCCSPPPSSSFISPTSLPCRSSNSGHGRLTWGDSHKLVFLRRMIKTNAYDLPLAIPILNFIRNEL